MNSKIAIEVMKLGKQITSENNYGYFFMNDGDDTIFYSCLDSGCNFCKSEYTRDEFDDLGYDFYIR
jgi:hypothetical protein